MAYATAATRIDHQGRGIAIETIRGTVRAARVIVAVPSAIIAEERLVFDPPLPDKLAAAAGMPLGLAHKPFFHFSAAAAERLLAPSPPRPGNLTLQVPPLRL